MKPPSTNFLRGTLIALVLFGAAPFLVLLRAQSSSSATATNAPATAADVTTNAAPANATPPAVTSSAAADQAANAAPLPPATNAAPGDTNAPSSDMEQQEGPPTPGEMASPGTELIGPPALGSSNAPEGAMPGNNPAVTDVTNNPGAVEGLGQRKLPFYFGLDLGEMYDDNILISPSDEKKDSFITHISPSIDYQMGDQFSPHMNYLNVYFAPAFYIYDTRSGYNRADYVGDIFYQYTWTRLALGIEQNYQHLTDATLDEGKLVSRNIYTTKGTASYICNDNLTLYGTATQSLNDYPGLNINEWDLDTYALYQIAPKLSIGAGPRFAFIDISDAASERHQDLLARLRYVPDHKFVVSFEGGVEYLQYESSQASRVLPIFDMNLTYLPADDTSLFISAGRSTLNSYDAGGDTIDYDNVQLGASQIFLEHFNATALAGYAAADYQQTDAYAGAVQRQDNYFFAKGSVQWTPNQWLKVEASYQWSKNNSNVRSSLLPITK